MRIGAGRRQGVHRIVRRRSEDARRHVASKRCKVARRRRSIVRMAVVSPESHWACWTALLFATAMGSWSQKTAAKKFVTGETVSIVMGLGLSNLGVVPFEAPVYDFVNEKLLPLGVALLMLQANLRRMFKETGKLLAMFSLGSVGTVLGTLIAFKLVPLTALGEDRWKIASALAASYIGGSANFVGTSSALQASPEVVGAALAADNILCAFYFAFLFYLARNLAPDSEGKGQSQGQLVEQASASFNEDYEDPFNFLQCATAIAVSSVFCACGTCLAVSLGVPGYSIPLITLLVTFFATAFPRWMEPLSPSGEGVAGIIINIFLASVGASGSILGMLQNAPFLFLFCFVQVGFHLVFCFVLGRLFGFDRRDILLASNANVGGPTTAVAMAVSKGWRRSFVPAMLVGTFGYAIATFLCVALGFKVLRFM